MSALARSARAALVWSLAAGGCTDVASTGDMPPPVVDEHGSVAHGGDARWVRWLALANGSPAVIAASPARGQLDLLTRAGAAGDWQLFGTYYAGGAPVALLDAHVQGRQALLVLTSDGDVYGLLAAAGDPRRFDFPVRVIKHVVAMTAADVDGDGDDELIVARGPRLFRVQLDKLPGADPEHPPSFSRRAIASFAASAIAAADLDGDGAPELLALGWDGSAARVYAAGDEDDVTPVDLDLPEPATRIVTTECADVPLAVIANSGAVLGVPAGDTGDAEWLALAAMPSRDESIATAAGASAHVTPGTRTVAFGDDCLQSSTEIDLAAPIAAIDLMTGEGVPWLAALAGARVEIYTVRTIAP